MYISICISHILNTVYRVGYGLKISGIIEFIHVLVMNLSSKTFPFSDICKNPNFGVF